MSSESLLDVLNDLHAHFKRYILANDEADLMVLTLWAAHTHYVRVLPSTPRLLLDSMLPGSGKTTVLEHLHRLTWKSEMAASLSSPALLARLLDTDPLALLIDEAQRNLDPRNPNNAELIAILNAGYKPGQTRPTLVASGKDWEVKRLSCYGPVAMAGIAPNLEDDTKSRAIRILLMPDRNGEVEESDWEIIEEDTKALRDRLAAVAEATQDEVRVIRPELPERCKGRIREKWAPLARVAHVAGGVWAETINDLINRDIDEIEAEQKEGLTNKRPEIQLLSDLFDLWAVSRSFARAADLVADLKAQSRYWTAESAYGRDLTIQRLGRLLTSGARIEPVRLFVYGLI